MLHHLYILPHIPDLNWPSYKKLQEAHPLLREQIDLSE
ncbi:hypothetical protein ECoD_05503 [Escherichia coli O157:H7 str. EC1212]|uniref:Uncharacterized protein n=1 Tax=Escherichia coli O157:H7 (strain EC869) TaxID=478008 RepID=A0A0H3PIM4_ECO5C|nr:hypothetical protein ECH7EC869_2490 [Escherichia coli O157:H7 str. EC869]EFW62561.1 hypothetical protein ECoD_05503 [Escherichia coli O157:H7 str. EC1212]EKH04019.1 hypothetical protein ECFRIK920_2867 [Escherichia coli FRIK920]ELV52419.1 hypothetical protein EC991775_3148 [Escherichia coli 99.1775]